MVQIEAQGSLTLDEAAIARAAVLDGAGIGFFIEQDVADDIAAGRMVRLLADWTPPRARFSLYYPDRRNPSAGFSAFRAMGPRRGRVMVRGPIAAAARPGTRPAAGRPAPGPRRDHS